jgi:hypothetical protein
MKLKSLLLILIAAAPILNAQKVKWDGYGNVGYIFYNRNMLNNYNQEAYYDGKLKADIEFDDNIEGQLYLKGSSTDNSVKVQELNVKFSLSDYLNLKIGNTKKPFGYEYLTSEEDLLTIDRSFVQENFEELGYGGHAIQIMAYYKYSPKRAEFPFTYYVSASKDNSLFTSVITRFSYHIGDFGIGANYMFENKGGEQKITTNAYGGGFFVENEIYNGMLELYLVQDPFESNRRKLIGNFDKALSLGGRFLLSYKFKMDEKFLKGIEPVFLASYFMPDTEISGTHTIQLIGGANIYLHKRIRARVNADLRYTKNNFNTDYGLEDSRLIFSMQMTF